MRFIVFYNNHPKVKDFSVRVWHQFQSHPNFSGEMTHSLFIKHYKFDPKSVSCLGDVLFNQKTKQWEIDKTRHLVVFPGYENVVSQNKDLVLNFMNKIHGSNQEMIAISLKEQALLKDIQRMSMLKNARSI